MKSPARGRLDTYDGNLPVGSLPAFREGSFSLLQALSRTTRHHQTIKSRDDGRRWSIGRGGVCAPERAVCLPSRRKVVNRATAHGRARTWAARTGADVAPMS